MKLLYLVFLLFTNMLSAIAQDVVVPFRAGDKWGVSDTAGNMILPAVYDSIVPNALEGSRYIFPDGFYLVYKDKKFGVVYDHRIIIPPVLHSVVFDTYNQFILDDLEPYLALQVQRNSYSGYWDPPRKSNKLIYNYQGVRIIPDTVQDYDRLELEHYFGDSDQKRNRALFWFSYANGKSGLAELDVNAQVVGRWLLNNEDILEIGQPDFQEIYVNCRESRKAPGGWVNIMPSHYEWLLATDSGQNVIPESQAAVLKGFYRVAYDSIGDSFNLVEMGPELFDTIFPVRNYRYYDTFYGCGSSALGYYGNLPPGALDNRYFFVLNGNTAYYIHKWAILSWRQYGYDLMFDTISKYTIDSTYQLVHYAYIPAECDHCRNSFILFREGRKFGIIPGPASINAEFDSVTRAYNVRQRAAFLIWSDGKTGILNDSGRHVTQIIYDSISHVPHRNGNYFLTFQKGLVGLASFEKGEILACAYDSIILLDDHNEVFLLKRKQRYGYFYHHLEKKSIEPSFEYKPLSDVVLGGKVFFRLYNNSGRLMGYGDTSGKVFYTNR